MYKILIVDDEKYIREGLRVLIDWEVYGYTICGEAEDGIQALQRIEEFKPDLVITDIKMPGISGIELIKRAREQGKDNLKFIILSGYNEFEFAKSAMKYNVKWYVLKPVDEDELIATLKDISLNLKKEYLDNNERQEGIKQFLKSNIKALLSGAVDRTIVSTVKEIFQFKSNESIAYVIVELKKDDKITKNSVKIREKIIKVLGEKYDFNVIEEDDFSVDFFKFGIIVSGKMLQSCSIDYRNFVCTIFNKLSKEINNIPYIFAGKMVEDICYIKESYNSAVLAKNFKFFKEDNEVIFYDDVRNIELNKDFRKKLKFENLIQAIENNENESCYRIIDEIFDNLKFEYINPKVITVGLNYFVYEVVNLILKMNGDTECFIKNSLLVNFDTKELTLHETKNSITEFIKMSINYLNELRRSQSSGIVDRVQKYIDDNYHENINLKSVAAHFYINSAYLGQVFKKKFGMCFVDYLHSIRIQKAKELLKTTDMKVYQIAIEVGYKDTDYFIAKFEKIVGRTPFQFRKNYDKVNM